MLSDAKARKLKPNDKAVSDGTILGLYLVPGGRPGSGKWIFRFLSPATGKRREMGLGSYPTTSIRDARVKSFEARCVIDDGNDPLEIRRKQEREAIRLASVPTFAKRHASTTLTRRKAFVTRSIGINGSVHLKGSFSRRLEIHASTNSARPTLQPA